MFWQKPVFWVIFLIVLIAILIPLSFYFFKPLILQNVPVISLFNKTQPKTSQQSTLPLPTPVYQKLSLVCPVPKEFCQSAKVLGEETEGRWGLGFALPPGTPVLAVFSGQVSSEPKIADRSPKQPYLYLRDLEGNEIFYSFYGTLSASIRAEVSAGAQIGKIGPGTFPAGAGLDGLNFFLTLKKDGKYQKISPTDLGE